MVTEGRLGSLTLVACATATAAGSVDLWDFAQMEGGALKGEGMAKPKGHKGDQDHDKVHKWQMIFHIW